MPDLGQVLYEIHCENIRKLQPHNGNLLLPWNRLPASAVEAWRESAKKFLKFIGER